MDKLYPSSQSFCLKLWVRIGIPICFLILVGCATNPVVLEADRDTTGKFDGVWVITAEGRAGEQYSGTETLRFNTLKWRSFFYVQPESVSLTVVTGR